MDVEIRTMKKHGKNPDGNDYHYTSSSAPDRCSQRAHYSIEPLYCHKNKAMYGNHKTYVMDKWYKLTEKLSKRPTDQPHVLAMVNPYQIFRDQKYGHHQVCERHVSDKIVGGCSHRSVPIYDCNDERVPYDTKNQDQKVSNGFADF